MDNIPLEAVLFDKEVIYHPTREGEIFEAIFHKDRGILKETRRPYREFTSATAFVHGHVTTKYNGRLVCRVLRDGTEYRLQELYDNIKVATISKEEAKVVTPVKSKEPSEMPPAKKIQPQQMKGLLPVKHPESIIARFKESDKPPVELTSVTILKVVEYEWHGSKYWFDETNMNLYTKDNEGIGDLVGRLNEKGQLTLASTKE
jgi:hypothetical protein